MVKKGSKDSRGNYGPASILLSVSKMNKGCLFSQMFSYFENVFSKYQCGFREGVSAKYCLIYIWFRNESSWKSIHSYSTNWKRMARINSAYSSWKEILFDVPHRPLVGLLLFNIFICNIFSILSNMEFTNYAHGTAPYVIGDGSKEVIGYFKKAWSDLVSWFAINQMKSNSNKYHLIASCDNEMSICVNTYNLTNNQCEKLL